jgi:hypothetical protein
MRVGPSAISTLRTKGGESYRVADPTKDLVLQTVKSGEICYPCSHDTSRETAGSPRLDEVTHILHDTSASGRVRGEMPDDALQAEGNIKEPTF